ncbi:MAG: hypothetical protein WD800_02240 [Dehalococcoidia bacterium]
MPPHDATPLDQARALRERLVEDLPAGLVTHVDRVVEVGDELARRWGLDAGLVRLMAQAHDVARHLGDAEWLARAAAYGIPVDDIERGAPVLLHGPVGAEDLRRRYGIEDERVLFAVRWHTPGHPDYPAEAWAMFIADKVEPHKVADWPLLADVRRIALEEGLEAAALAYLDLRLQDAVRTSYAVQPQLVTTRNALLARR